jgi:nucleoside-diphosphate-sugar epimerase
MLHRVPAIEKIKGAIGWEPKRSLDEILNDVVDHVRSTPVTTEPLIR